MRVFPALIQRNLSLSSIKTDIRACMMPMVDVILSESSPPARLNN